MLPTSLQHGHLDRCDKRLARASSVLSSGSSPNAVLAKTWQCLSLGDKQSLQVMVGPRMGPVDNPRRVYLAPAVCDINCHSSWLGLGRAFSDKVFKLLGSAECRPVSDRRRNFEVHLWITRSACAFGEIGWSWFFRLDPLAHSESYDGTSGHVIVLHVDCPQA